MKRMFIFSVIISFFLMSYSAVAAPEVGTPNGKSLYSNRPNRVLRTSPEKFPTLAPDNSSPTLSSPEPWLAPPTSELQLENSDQLDQLLENKTFSNKTQPIFPDFSSTVPVLDSPNPTNQPPKINQPRGIVIDEPIEVRPLSKIDVNSASTGKTERTEVYKKTDATSGSHFASRTTFPNQPILAGNDQNKQEIQLDELNARLAKIQLEKHNLNETLKLIDKIQSSAIKARTLVDLAEYVSRDNNYKKEADQLYALAVDGIDALTKGEAIVIKIKSDPKNDWSGDSKKESVLSSSSVTDTKTSGSGTPSFTEPKKPTESVTTSPRKPTLTLLDEDKPVESSNSQVESASKTIPIPKLNESSAETHSIIKTPNVPDTSSVAPNVPKPKPVVPVLAPPEESSAPTPTAKKTPILLEDDPKTMPLLEENKTNVTKKEAISSPTPTKRPMMLLDDESEIPDDEKSAEIKTPPSVRKPSLLLREEPDTNVESEKNVIESTTKPESPAKEESEIKLNEKSDTKLNSPPAAPKSQRRAMPGRNKVTLEEN
ncbi:MAG: hypothetical protein LBI18_14490 [Planctomycetaceae bacterium]|nr:hypothetical protein [Planctomycetaceae bacterium]